ncbi:MAG: hypothetical protein A3B74_03060 [Candidatus Kerfeldbacteria bacterium RIFCSPHIGHO2_02_FULL_42_14]|uniref:Uncharacterized protein n=1 Tax=Candidatus Kerfeldbacteria bacterium RIFCSPHIGHO2_02_FULL_42_14 TaxID=1798540 RepID=A0A1G2AQH0_9BACT|nr:MAG: hypothetical protein A3B74_03060 [Candidatus Kerfeldbacteria bacterium RIFCSPHIGHO2_02_FULL_42_14]OGY84123.1 MAG: hypothetical protein A3I91_01370 [Candidatus Kerfeldbacteria bacterium RIFCSPLOWO2_02_FULL_42_19]OGY87253.1 MAG: hypothetical protein A3G01_02840 [Candidatus Kerfeldbacteria bacterium RIFCSPLOWO2_12_FULL_43_9]
MSTTDDTDKRLLQLAELRKKHGFQGQRSAGQWSKGVLAQQSGSMEELPAQQTQWPKNALLYNLLSQKFGFLGFNWEAKEKVWKGSTRRFVDFVGYPMVAGYHPSLTELAFMPIELVDNFEEAQGMTAIRAMEGLTAVGFENKRARMDATGIGYKGMSGVSWIPALEPIVLPTELRQQLQRLADAVLLLNDAVTACYTSDSALQDLLTRNVPSRIPQIMAPGTVDVIRPDIVIVREKDGFRPVVTELESAPAGMGMLHAMEVGYGVDTTMLDRFIEYLDGRQYVIFATHQWAEYTFELAVFCQALRTRGVPAWIIFDRLLETVQEHARKTWQLPPNAPEHVCNAWDTDFLGRITRLGFREFIRGSHELPKQFDDRTVVYRFGYFDNFSRGTLEQMLEWQQQGITVINPVQFPLESKVLMAAIGIPSVRRWITERDEEAVWVLQTCLAETRLLNGCTETELSEYTNDRPFWISKYAAWDGNNQSWGSRSLEVGAQHLVSGWEGILRQRRECAWPVVVQHMINSARFTVGCVNSDGKIAIKTDLRNRLTPFFLRGKDGKAVMTSSMITLRGNTIRIHGATDAVETLVVYRD